MLPFSGGTFDGLDALKCCRLLAAAYNSPLAVDRCLGELDIFFDWEVELYRRPESTFLGGMLLRFKHSPSTYALFLPGMSTASHVSQTLNGWNVPSAWDNVGVGNRFFRDTAIRCLESFRPHGDWNGKKVLVVGHSAGGGAAEFLFNSSTFKQKTNYAELITFGAPKPFVAVQSGSVSDRPAYRVFCEDDPVPLMPGQGVYELTNKGPLALLQGNALATWCHCRNGISLSAYGKWEQGFLPLYSVNDADALSRLLPQYGAGLFPNHAIVEYARRLQIVADQPPLELGMFVQAPVEEGRPLIVQINQSRRVIPVVLERRKVIRADNGLPVPEPACMTPTLRMRSVRTRAGFRSVRWMGRNVGTFDEVGGLALVRRWNGLLKSMLRNGKWSRKNLVVAFQTFLDAASGGAPGSIEPPMRTQ